MTLSANAESLSPEQEVAQINAKLSKPWTVPQKSLSQVAPVKKRRMDTPTTYGRANKTLSG